MANEHNIPQFSADDIQRYHRGQMTNQERHLLEKAAMDDPFLADALEGYAVPNVNLRADLADLANRLSNRTEQARVIPIGTAPTQKRNQWLRAAVVIAFLAGAALLTYQLGFNKHQSKDLALNNKPAEKTTPSITPSTDTPGRSTGEVVTTSPKSNGIENKGKPVSTPSTRPSGSNGRDNIPTGNSQEIVAKKQPATPITEDAKASPVSMNEERKEVAARTPVEINSGNGVNDSERQQVANLRRNNNAAKTTAGSVPASNNRRNMERADVARQPEPVNVFRGVVTDRDNNPVPFAKITNTEDNNSGTYSDARGNFNITSYDSVLNVQVRSIGYENSVVQLRNSSTVQVKMQEDRNLDKITLESRKIDTTGRDRFANVKLEQPEPADGWENYNAYIANNVTLPEDLKEKKMISGEVQVSFEVDKAGEPTNIKIVKSLCDRCDQEAIRLVKEGPKWKRKAKKGRTIVTINF